MVIITPRLQLFELEDQQWCPAPIREGIQTLLHLFWVIHIPPLTQASSASHVGDIIIENLPDAGSFDFIDNCAGGGGPTPTIAARVNERLASQGKDPARFVLTDLYPHISAWDGLCKKNDSLTYVSKSVNAASAGRLARKGKRECRMFSLSFHHMDDKTAMSILRSTVENADAIVINELLCRDISSFLLAIFGGAIVALVYPLIYLWDSPMHLLLTYLIPAIPLALVFDGVVSAFRARTEADMLDLLRRQPDLDISDWDIKSGYKMTVPPLGNLYWWMAVKKQV